MATVHFRNAVILVDGYDLSTSLAEFGVDYGCETLDETAFGDTTRTNKAGLFTARMSGKGHCEFGAAAIEYVVFSRVGVDGSVVAVFPDGVTVGTQTKKGYAMLGVIDSWSVGGAVGTLLPIDFAVSSRGITP